MKSICLFCGASSGNKPDYAEAARQLGTSLAQNGITLVYGGSNIGLMGAAADAALAAGGEVIGVIPEFLRAKEVAHTGLGQLHITTSMHERKALMAELSDGFIALPGGFGTFDELFEILTWAQLSVHRKPVGLLNVAGYYDPLMAMVHNAINAGFVRDTNLKLFSIADTVSGLLESMQQYQPQTAKELLSISQA